MTLTPGDRAAGSLLGLALGDALGFVVEAAPAAQAAEYVRTELRQGLAGTRARAPFSPGQYSDDTQLARELLLSISDSRRFDPAAFAARVARLFVEGRVVGWGPGSLGAAERLAAGASWELAGTPPPYAGNGAAMRAGPLGALYAGDHRRLVAVARNQALVTHRDSRAVAGSVAVAAAAALGAAPGPLNGAELLAQVAALVGEIDPSMAAAVRGVAGWLALTPEAAARLVSNLEDPGTNAEWNGLSPFVTCGVAWSLYAFLRSPDDYWETVCTAIGIGGDTDTVAAMAGAMGGARLGPEALPAAILDRLTDRGTWGCADLLSLARRCEVAVRDGPSA
jgi:ADP-ribosylglycohydrolase